MTRRPQNIKKLYDTVFFSWEPDEKTQYILGGYVIGFPDSYTAAINVSTLYSITFIGGVPIYGHQTNIVLPQRVDVSTQKLKHINDVRFLK